jgi:hypothetical protein
MFVLLILSVPAAFAGLLVFMLIRQRRIDAMHREGMADLDGQIKRNFDILRVDQYRDRVFRLGAPDLQGPEIPKLEKPTWH